MSRLLEHYTDPMGRFTDEAYGRIHHQEDSPFAPIHEAEELCHTWLNLAIPDAGAKQDFAKCTPKVFAGETNEGLQRQDGTHHQTANRVGSKARRA
jgi:hypothetical protein